MKTQLTKKNVIRGIGVFLFLTVLGLTLVFLLTSTGQSWLAILNIKFRYLIIAGILTLVDYFSGAGRLYIFVKKIDPSQKFITCIKAYLSNIFLSAATPFRAGGGFGQLYILNHNGVPYSAGFPIIILNFVATLFILLIAGSLILNSVADHFALKSSTSMIIDISRFSLYFTMGFFFIFMLQPQLIGKFLEKSSSLFPRVFSHKKRTSGTRKDIKIITFIQEYQKYLHYYWKKGKSALFLNFVITFILYFNKCLMAYVIFSGMGLHLNFWEVISLQMLLLFFIYFAPTPGSSFIAESGTSAVISLIAPLYLVSIFTVLWMFFLTYLGVILGSIVLLRAISHSYHLSVSTAAEVRQYKMVFENRF